MKKYNTVLIVDDDEFNLDILNTYLSKSGYHTELAEGGLIALNLLERDPERYSLVLLDRMMPEMDGMEVLEQMKAHKTLKYLPVVMQTAATAPQQIAEGISQGVYYYLTKPFSREVLLMVVSTAIKDYKSFLTMMENLRSNKVSMKSLDKAQFTFKTIEEGVNIVNLLAHASQEPLQTGIGLKELVVNAVEHGNLGITYGEKGDLLSTDSWEEEIERRLQLPENRDKTIILSFEKKPSVKATPMIEITIRDQGDGFNWNQYLEFSMDRIYDTHGRGILVANNSFSRMEYKEKGRTVTVWVNALDGE